jgi:hypothetical protein
MESGQDVEGAVAGDVERVEAEMGVGVGLANQIGEAEIEPLRQRRDGAREMMRGPAIVGIEEGDPGRVLGDRVEGGVACGTGAGVLLAQQDEAVRRGDRETVEFGRDGERRAVIGDDDRDRRRIPLREDRGDGAAQLALRRAIIRDDDRDGQALRPKVRRIALAPRMRAKVASTCGLRRMKGPT